VSKSSAGSFGPPPSPPPAIRGKRSDLEKNRGLSDFGI
jgi:hypothetical protein